MWLGAVSVPCVPGLPNMETIAKHVASAGRRLFVARFLRALAWTASAAFVSASLAIAVGKFWPPAMPQGAWIVGWLIVAAILGPVAAAFVAWRTRGDRLRTAIEIDRRLGLEARVATALGLGPHEVTAPMGQALVRDAEQRLERLRSPSSFPRGSTARLGPRSPPWRSRSASAGERRRGSVLPISRRLKRAK